MLNYLKTNNADNEVRIIISVGISLRQKSRRFVFVWCNNTKSAYRKKLIE